MRGIQFRKAVWILEITAQCTYRIRDILRRKCTSSHVLMFHDISIEKDSGNDMYAVTMQRLKEILLWHKKHRYRFKSVNEIQSDTKEKCCFMTFDDGYKSVLQALPLMEQYGVPFCIYIITSKIGNQDYLSEQDIIKIARNPLCTIGAHTHTHPYTRYLKREELESELMTCRKILEDLTSLKIEHFAYPYGSAAACSVFDDSAVRRAGFQTIMTTKQTALLPGYKYRRIPRFDGSRKDLLEIL